MTNSTALDQVTLVDENDNVIGAMDKIEAHRGIGKRHRAISVFLFNDQSELLVQQRSVKKIVGALQWGNTCCGNVRPGESYLECAMRRLKDELGITKVSLTELYDFKYQVQCNDEFSENEIDHVFAGKYQQDTHLNPDEVAQISWVKWSEIQENPSKFQWFPWFEIMLADTTLMNLLTKYVQN